MSNTNILASVQQERLALIEMVAYLLHKPANEVDLVADVSTLGDIIVNQSDELGMIDYRGYKEKVAALESEQAAAIDALNQWLCLIETTGDLLAEDSIYELWTKHRAIVTAYDARQSTEVLPPVASEPLSPMDYRELFKAAMRASDYPLLGCKVSAIDGVWYECWNDDHQMNLFIVYSDILDKETIDDLIAVVKAHEAEYEDKCGLIGAIVLPGNYAPPSLFRHYIAGELLVYKVHPDASLSKLV